MNRRLLSSLYPRNLLAGLILTSTLLALAVTGLTFVVFGQNGSIAHLSQSVQTNNADRRHDIDALMRSSQRQQAADAARSRAELREIRRLRVLVRHLGGNPGPVCCDVRPAPASTSRGSSRPAPAPARAPRPSHSPEPEPEPSHPPRPSPSPSPSCKVPPVIC